MTPWQDAATSKATMTIIRFSGLFMQYNGEITTQATVNMNQVESSYLKVQVSLKHIPWSSYVPSLGLLFEVISLFTVLKRNEISHFQLFLLHAERELD